MTTQTAAAQQLAGRREWIGLFILSIACLIYSMDLSVLFLAIPSIVTDLAPNPTEILWINDMYGFMVAGFLVTMGNLGDRIGRRKVLLIGAAAFGADSVLAAFSTSATMLIIARALQGIAGATIAPSTLSLIVSLFHNETERNRALGIWGTAFALGGLIGPVIGGVLLQYFHWGSVFLINVPIMIGLLIAAPYFLPEFKNENSDPLDLISVALSLAAVLPIIYALKDMAAYGFQPIALFIAAIGLMFGWIFIKRQRTLSNPLIDLALFRLPAFSASLIVNLAGMFFVFGVFLFQNQYLQLVLKLSPLEAGLWSVIPSVMFAFMSLNAWRVTEKLGATRSVVVGLVIYALGTACMALSAITQSLYGILGSSMIIAIGFVPVVLTTTGLIVGAAPVEQAGSASAISETSAEFGGALGIALMGSLGTFIYRAAMAKAQSSGLSTESIANYQASLGAAVDEAQKLGITDAPWLVSARQAFADGFALNCAIAAVSLTLLAWLAARIYATNDVKVASH
jgi:DHA2 family multidrug resistance protein-like MFS transporter